MYIYISKSTGTTPCIFIDFHNALLYSFDFYKTAILTDSFMFTVKRRYTRYNTLHTRLVHTHPRYDNPALFNGKMYFN